MHFKESYSEKYIQRRTVNSVLNRLNKISYKLASIIVYVHKILEFFKQNPEEFLSLDFRC